MRVCCLSCSLALHQDARGAFQSYKREDKILPGMLAQHKEDSKNQWKTDLKPSICTGISLHLGAKLRDYAFTLQCLQSPVARWHCSQV